MSIEALFNERNIFAEELQTLNHAINTDIITILEVAIENETINTLIGDEDYWMESGDHPNTIALVDKESYAEGEHVIDIVETSLSGGVVSVSIKFADGYDECSEFTFDVESSLMGADMAVIKTILETRRSDVIDRYDAAQAIIKEEEQREAMEEKERQIAELDALRHQEMYNRYGDKELMQDLVDHIIRREGDNSSRDVDDYMKMVKMAMAKSEWVRGYDDYDNEYISYIKPNTSYGRYD